MLGSSCVSWLSKKQPNVATSSCEAEYKAFFTATIECVWLRCLMVDLGVGQNTTNAIYTNSQSALAVARNLVFYARTKKIEVHYHYFRERLSAKEISLAYVPTQGVWLRCLMVDLGVGQNTTNTIYIDNQSALAVVRNPIFHARTKHIEVHYHYVRERLLVGEISLAYAPTQGNVAEIFTKALSCEKFEAFRKALGLLPFLD
ncbi:hypothetical protein L7F22_064025 [Adiantum nelumboides]|nr:hypothetical protein [Adiantum nelumboides]